MSAYKTPAEKLSCILRCTQTIQNLLCLACNSSVPSADNLVPVLVYVIIMVSVRFLRECMYLTLIFNLFNMYTHH